MTPEAGPGVVLFDGDCGICNASREWAQGRDRAGQLMFLPYQTANLEGLSPGLTREMAARSAYFVHPDGRHVGGARAIFETLRHLPGVWSIVGTVMSQLPFWLLAEPFYYLIARNRGRLSSWLGLSYCLVDGRPIRQEPRSKPFT